MTVINMDPTQAISCGEQITKCADVFDENVEKIYDIVDSLHNNWTGNAAQRFTENVESYKEDYMKFAKLIRDFGNLLTAIGKDYRDLEDHL